MRGANLSPLGISGPGLGNTNTAERSYSAPAVLYLLGPPQLAAPFISVAEAGRCRWWHRSVEHTATERAPARIRRMARDPELAARYASAGAASRTSTAMLAGNPDGGIC